MDGKRFLFASLDEPLIGDLTWQVRREGHEVEWHIASETEREIGDGVVPKTDDCEVQVEWADVIVFDDIWVTARSASTRSPTDSGKKATR